MLNKNALFRKKNFLLLAIILVSVLFRFWQLGERGVFEADQETVAWMTKQLLVDHKPTLLGVITSSGNIFLGPLYYYLYSLPMMLTNMNPIGQLALSSLLGVFTTINFYIFGKKIYSENVGLIAAFLHATSLIFIGWERPIWNVTACLSIFLFIYYCYFKIANGSKKYWAILLFLIGLSLNFHLTGIFFIPTTVLFFSFLFFSKKNIVKEDLLYFIIGIFLFTAILSPLVIFDIRHSFLNSKNILTFFTGGSGIGQSFIGNIPKITNDIFLTFTGFLHLPFFLSLFVFAGTIYFLAKNRLSFFAAVVILYLTGILGFSLFKGQITNYYYLLFFPPFIFGLSLLSDFLVGLNRATTVLVVLYLTGLLFINSYNFLFQTTSFSFATKEKVVNFITSKADKKPYYVSYSIEYGRNFGFSYLFWLSQKEPSRDLRDPVYTIVIPSDFGGIKPDLLINDIGVVMPKN